MRSCTKLLAAAVAGASLSISGVAFADDKIDEKTKTQIKEEIKDLSAQISVDAPDAARTAALPAGIAPRALDDGEDLAELLANATESAVNKDGLDKLVSYMNDEDRNRLGKRDKLLEESTAKLNGRIDQIRKTWKAKYGEDLDIDVGDEKDRSPYMTVTFLQGEIQDPTLVMTSWPVTAQGRRLPSDAVADVGELPASPLTQSPTERANLEKGREVAIAHFGGSDNAPPVTISIIGEAFGWKIDIPNHVDAGQLHDNLIDHLTYFGEHQDKWPADRQQAERMLTHCVMLALYDVPVSKRTDAAPDLKLPMQPSDR